MAHAHGPHVLGPHPPFHHVCMMEGPDPKLQLSTLQFENVVDENKRYQQEIETLTALLSKHNIQYPAGPFTASHDVPQILSAATPPQGTGTAATPTTTRLPIEILLRILAFALKSKSPIIDPFYTFRKENATALEYARRGSLNINCLAVSHAFRKDGIRLLIESNDFIFTQAAALENFAKFPLHLRATIKHVTLRVVGRYYDDKARRVNLSGIASYHQEIAKLVVPVQARPAGMINDRGIQAYCWYQVGDFFKALQLPPTTDSTSTCRPKLFPKLTSMRLDLVNFCDHLPLGIATFAPVIRWHLGRFLDELLITGCPHNEVSADEKQILRNTLRDEGLFSTACPAFISGKHHLKRLSVHEYKHAVLCHRVKKCKKHSAPNLLHPEGGSPPVSTYPEGTTVWKWAKTEDKKPKEWIEFERLSGRPMSEVELDHSYDDEDIDPLTGMAPPGFPPGLLAQASAIMQGAIPLPLESGIGLSDSDDTDGEMPSLLTVAGHADAPAATPDTDHEMPGLLSVDGDAGTPAAADNTDDEMPSLLAADGHVGNPGYDETGDEMSELDDLSELDDADDSM